MPGTNAGTGYPLTFRCAKCKKLRAYDDPGDRAGERWEVTGETKPLSPSQEGRGNPRALSYRAEYRCLDCGHIGWSRHQSMERVAKAQGIKLIDWDAVETAMWRGKTSRMTSDDKELCDRAFKLDRLRYGETSRRISREVNEQMAKNGAV